MTRKFAYSIPMTFAKGENPVDRCNAEFSRLQIDARAELLKDDKDIPYLAVKLTKTFTAEGILDLQVLLRDTFGPELIFIEISYEPQTGNPWWFSLQVGDSIRARQSGTRVYMQPASGPEWSKSPVSKGHTVQVFALPATEVTLATYGWIKIFSNTTSYPSGLWAKADDWEKA